MQDQQQFYKQGILFSIIWNTVIAINWPYTSLWQTFDARKENHVF